IDSGAEIDMNSKKITTTSGTINVNYSAKIDPFIVYKKTNGSIAGLYSNLSNAVSAVTPFNDETVEINSTMNVNSNVTIPLESTLKIMTNARLDIGSSNKITKPSISSLVIDGTPELNPDIRLKSGTTLLGLYGSIAGAFSDGSYVETRDTISLSDNLVISTGKTLSVKSGSKYFLPSGKYLNVSGTLNATSATFTKASTSWGGIKYLSGSSGSLNSCSISNSTYGVYFNSSNPSIDDCTISGATYGLYCTSASPDIENCTISNCSTYGLYAYNASPYLETNSISDSRVYMNNCSSELYDNLIEDGAGSYFFHIYDSSPILDNNTITTEDAMIAIYADNGSEPEFGGGSTGIPTGGIGLNVLLSDNADFVVLANDGSDVLLGTGDAGPYVPCYNTIIGGGVCPIGEIDSYIEAQYCWWGSDDEPDYYGDPDDVNVANYLPDEPPTIYGDPGSSLAKTIFSPNPTYVSGERTSPEKVLMNEAKQKEKDGEYKEAISIYKNVILRYEYSKYANQALMKALKLYRKYEIAGAETFLDELIENVSDKTLLGYINARKVSHYRRNGELNKAIRLSEEIVENYPESVRENTSLFDLFNFYHKELNDMKKAEKYLDELKMKYPESYLTVIARSDWGEDVSDVQLTKPTYNEEEITEEIIIPEAYELKAAAPNPFNPSTTLEYSLPAQSSVKCSIFDVAGNLINEYNYDQNAGNHKIVWDGSEVSSGIYLIRFVAEASDGSETFVDYQKVTLLK
ncbi:MAG: right-handed parallel beta-helix repeat-containing protein, partial [Eubacteriales bacterium]